MKVRMKLCSVLPLLQQNIRRVHERNANAYHMFLAVFHFMGFLQNGVGMADHLFGFCVDQFPGFCQGKSLGAAVKKFDIQMTFQKIDLFGYGICRYIEFIGCLQKTSAVSNLDKGI